MMEKKKGSRRKRQKAVAETKTKPDSPAASGGKEDEGLDFGGLPNRDLKKNLGCG